MVDLMKKLHFVSLVLCFLFLAVVPARAQGAAPALRDLETRGTLSRFQDGQIADNVWQGVSRDEALVLVNALPDSYASPIYYDLARKLLLSDAPPFADVPSAKGKKGKAGKDGKDDAADADKSSATRPDILIARLDKLLAMGALRDAQALYDALVDDIPSDFDLVYRNLEMLMLRGQLSAACLDLQAMKGLHGGNAKWKELNAFCRIQFAQGPEREKLAGETKFVQFPSLGDFVRGRGAASLSSLSTEGLAFAVATGRVGPETIVQLSPQAGRLRPLLLSVLLDMDTPQDMPQKVCLAIEAARRGLASTRDLITLYEKPHYDSSLLLGNVAAPPAVAGMHPCMVPTVLYQRIASNNNQPAHDQAIRTAFSMMKDLPDAALWPMAVYLRDMDVRASANKPYVWRATRVLAYEKGELPADWIAGWGGQGGRGVAPFWPIQAVMSPSPDARENLDLWRSLWPSEAKRIVSRDPAVPLLLGVMLTGKSDKVKGKTKEKPNQRLSDYENIFSLTFSRSYAMPSYGLTQRLSDVIEKGQAGQSIALLLIGYGAIPPEQVFPHQMAVVIDAMNKAGLAQSARRFALEVLQ